MEYNYTYNTTLEKLEIFYYFTQLPVSLYSNNLPISRFPEKYFSIDLLLNNNNAFPNIIFAKIHTNCRTYQRYYEYFIVLEFNNPT